MKNDVMRESEVSFGSASIKGIFVHDNFDFDSKMKVDSQIIGIVTKYISKNKQNYSFAAIIGLGFSSLNDFHYATLPDNLGKDAIFGFWLDREHNDYKLE